MASQSIKGGATFPEGTTVGAYPVSQIPPEGGPPIGSATSTATVTNGELAFTGLVDGANYVAYAASPNRYKRFSAPSAAVSTVLPGSFGPRRLTPPVAEAGQGFTDIVSNGRHNAFPGACKTNDGRLIVVYRDATAHTGAGVRGVIVTRFSADKGVTWSAPTTVYDNVTEDAGAGGPKVSLLSDGRLALTFAVATTNGAHVAQACRVMFSSDNGATWGTAITPTDNFTQYSSCEAAIVEYKGALWWPIFGRNTADAAGDFWSCATLKSTNGGATWTQVGLVADGPAASLKFVESSYAVAADGSLLATINNYINAGTSAEVRVYRSTDGVTWAWANGAGGPTINARSVAPMLVLASGRIYTVVRDFTTTTSLQAVLYYSDDNGTTWGGPVTVENRAYMEMVYAVPVEVADGVVGVALANENTGQTQADLVWRWIFDRPGVSPSGIVASESGIVGDRDLSQLYKGETTFSRDAINSAVIGMTSQTLRLSFFRALRSETITQLELYAGAVAAGATPTLIRYGVYSVAWDGKLTLIASTPNDTALLNAVDTAFPKTLSAPWSKVRGQMYALGALVVTAAAVPQVAAHSGSGPAFTRRPRLAGAVIGQADLPATVVPASIAASGARIFMAMLGAGF